MRVSVLRREKKSDPLLEIVKNLFDNAKNMSNPIDGRKHMSRTEIEYHQEHMDGLFSEMNVKLQKVLDWQKSVDERLLTLETQRPLSGPQGTMQSVLDRQREMDDKIRSLETCHATSIPQNTGREENVSETTADSSPQDGHERDTDVNTPPIDGVSQRLRPRNGGASAKDKGEKQGSNATHGGALKKAPPNTTQPKPWMV